MKLSDTVQELVDVFVQDTPRVGGHSGAGTAVSRTISALAVIYEKARNAVEFRAEHLVRRAAIQRMIKRRIMLGGSAGSVASNLITELLWAKYIDPSLVDDEMEARLTIIIDKYLTVKEGISAGHISINWDDVLGMASSEIDEVLVSPKKRQALLNFFYRANRPKISLPGIDKRNTDLLTFAASEQAYMKSDDALTSYHLINLIDPTWTANTSSPNTTAVAAFAKNFEITEGIIKNPNLPAIFRYLRKQVPAFLLLQDFFADTGNKCFEFIEDPAKLEEKLTEVAQRRYNLTGKNVRRAMIRSFIYIFLTKMLFAAALEVPYDLYVAKHFALIPLLVNVLFPPFMLIMIAGIFSVPGLDNTRRLIGRINKLLYNFEGISTELDTFTMRQIIRRPGLTAGFSFIYLATFAVTFGLINIALSALQFSIVSKVIFVFFSALVSFFAYRIRHSAKEYEMIERQGVFEPFMDFFLMPVLQAGQFLSKEIAKINIFIFFFDFILEAPLKTIFDVFEEWVRFIHAKKDEMI